MKHSKYRIIAVSATIIALLAAMFVFTGKSVLAEDIALTARPSANGTLSVKGSKLVDEKGEKVALRGVSTHGLLWYPQFVDRDLFARLSSDWNCDLIRLVAYSDQYSAEEEDAKKTLELVQNGIDYAIDEDMYVLVDWHILNDSDPNDNKDKAEEFFDIISKKYKDVPNVIYEICNEPNGDTTWEDISAYAKEIIPMIRDNDPDSVIIVGTPDYDRALTVASVYPLPFENIMYTCHFYTASHYDVLKAEFEVAMDNNVPVFVTECGLSEKSGDGKTDFENAADWFRLLKENDISYAIWSFSDKAETSAFINAYARGPLTLSDDELTPVGKYARALIRGEDPLAIPIPEEEKERSFTDRLSGMIFAAGTLGVNAVRNWPYLALVSCVLIAACMIAAALYLKPRRKSGRCKTYDDLVRITDDNADKAGAAPSQKELGRIILRRIVIFLSTLLSLIYLTWRIRYSIPAMYGAVPVIANIILLIVELFGFAESIIHYENMSGMKEHPVPHIDDDEYPDVDVFIATYNEPEDLLRRTINGCVHLKYPDRSKVHIYVCDDNRRKSMRSLAESMGVGYFDRPDNQGAKAGNLNNALKQTSSPYVVTLDADMIPRSDFLLKTIPYFVDAEKRCEKLPENERAYLGLLQSPQSFYDPDVFQHNLHSERRVPNEQDFFYRTIEAARTSTNSVIYGGSNTVLSRKALEDVGGFYTGSITEDFATGMNIEGAGYLSLGISEPLASGRTPDGFSDHVKQRIRWGRGVISTARQLKLLGRKDLSLIQKISYLSSVVYWYSPVKNLIYMTAPLLYATFLIPVFRCSFIELAVYWLPMFLMQDICLRVVSGNSVSSKWSGIYETCVMPYLLIPVVEESLGITMSTFKVTDKSGKGSERKADIRLMAPYLVLIALSVIGIIRMVCAIDGFEDIGLVVILFWLIRNLYFALMGLFLVDGRDSDNEPVHVIFPEPVTVRCKDEGTQYTGVTTHLTEHGFDIFLDTDEKLCIGDIVNVAIETTDYRADVKAAVIGIKESRRKLHRVYCLEITDMGDDELEYLAILYDRVPTLPQNLNRDIGIFVQIWNNIAGRISAK